MIAHCRDPPQTLLRLPCFRASPPTHACPCIRQCIYLLTDLMHVSHTPMALVAQLFSALAKCFPYEKSHDRDHSQLYQTYMHACMLTTDLATFTQHRRALPHVSLWDTRSLWPCVHGLIHRCLCWVPRPARVSDSLGWPRRCVCMLELSAMLSLAKPSLTLSTHTPRAERLRAGRPSTMKTLRAAIVAASLLQSVHAQCVARSGSQWSNHPSMPWAIDEVATAVVNNKL